MWKTQENGAVRERNNDRQEYRGVKMMKANPGLATRSTGKKRGRKSRKSF